jgi:hypothetical protein
MFTSIFFIVEDDRLDQDSPFFFFFFFCFSGVWSSDSLGGFDRWQWWGRRGMYVKLVFIIHVGGTRCVTSSTDNIMNIHARITLNVEFIRTCIFIF